jgi:hypothetical protein
MASILCLEPGFFFVSQISPFLLLCTLRDLCSSRGMAAILVYFPLELWFQAAYVLVLMARLS